MIKSDKITKIRNLVQQIKHDQHSTVVKTYIKPKSERLHHLHRRMHTETKPEPIGDPYPPKVQTDDLEPLMQNIRKLLDKNKVVISSKQKLDKLLSPASALKLYGRRRQQIESRFKELYQDNKLSHRTPQLETSQVEPPSPKNQALSVRLQKYQERIGLTKKKDSASELIEQIGRRWNIIK